MWREGIRYDVILITSVLILEALLRNEIFFMGSNFFVLRLINCLIVLIDYLQ